MSIPPDARLNRLLGGPQLESLRRRLRQRFERAPIDSQIETLRIGNLTSGEHTALAALLGRSQRFTNSVQIDLRLVDNALREAGIAESLRDALERLDGPITHLLATRAQTQAQWDEVVASCHHAGLIEFLHDTVGFGLLKRLSAQNPASALQLCRLTEIVLSRLPARGLTRAQLAAEMLGDAHALDGGRAVATLVLSVWRRLRLAPDAIPAEEQFLRGERARDVWASAGVLVNELARPVLFLNLPTHDSDSYGQAPGEPAYASLRVLLNAPPRWQVNNRDVYVCENPNLLAIAAAALGERCAPFICTDGMPAAAQRVLLDQMVRAGARLHYHGDFDWAGVRIGNHVMREYGARAWHFGAVDYDAAALGGRSPGHRLKGPAVIASWDGALTLSMQTRQLSIAEEAVAETLLKDLTIRENH